MQSKNLEAYFAARSTRTLSSLDQIARALRANEMMPSGARGRNAPRLQPYDIARFVIAAAATRSPTEAAEIVCDFEKLQPIHPVKGLPLKVLKAAEIKAPFTLLDYLACMFWAGWEDAQKHINSITFRRRPPHSELLFRFDVEISGDSGWGNFFEPVQKRTPPESIVRHNHAERALIVEETTLHREFLRGLFSAAKQSA